MGTFLTIWNHVSLPCFRSPVPDPQTAREYLYLYGLVVHVNASMVFYQIAGKVCFPPVLRPEVWKL